MLERSLAQGATRELKRVRRPLIRTVQSTFEGPVERRAWPHALLAAAKLVMATAASTDLSAVEEAVGSGVQGNFEISGVGARFQIDKMSCRTGSQR